MGTQSAPQTHELYQEARDALEAGDPAAAEAPARQLVEALEGSASAREVLGLSLLRQEKGAQAAPELARSMQLDPSRSYLRFAHARALEQAAAEAVGGSEHDADAPTLRDAMEAYNRAAEADVQPGRAHLAMARLLNEMGEVADARSRLEQTMPEVRQDPPARRAALALQHRIERELQRRAQLARGVGTTGVVQPSDPGPQANPSSDEPESAQGGVAPRDDLPRLSDLMGRAETIAAAGAAVRRTVPGRVNVNRPEVSGALPRAMVHRVLRRYLGQVRFCYLSSLGQSPDLAGSMGVRFQIGAAGGIETVAITHDDVSSASVRSCLQTAFRRWRFPAADDGGNTMVRATYSFRPGRR